MAAEHPPDTARLSRAFYVRDSVTVARALLGQRLVRMIEGMRLSGVICETEAYGGTDDPASHAFRRTDRSAIMYGPPGYAYVYLIYGVHHCLNAVTEPEGVPGAVLIRALMPSENVREMRRRRGLALDAAGSPGVADGPGKLCQALGVTLHENGLDLTAGEALFVEEGTPVREDEVVATPRVGIRGDEATRSRPWRFLWLSGQQPR